MVARLQHQRSEEVEQPEFITFAGRGPFTWCSARSKTIREAGLSFL
jgi:hypothetical protein